MDENLYIGLDFGTLSARAVLASSDNGQVLGESFFEYPHGVITGCLSSGRLLPADYALADPIDYREALFSCISSLLKETSVSPECIKGIGVAATTYTMVPCLEDGSALAEHEKYRDEPMAYIKLWKHHGASKQADKIAEVHSRTNGFPAIERYGHSVNCEWGLPKLLETFEVSPQIFSQSFRICDLGEWIIWILTGKPVNAMYTAGFKGMWTPENGYPQKRILNNLADGFGDAFYEKFAGKIHDYKAPCGIITKDIADRLGLYEGTIVATPMGDGSSPGIYYCLNNPGTLAITLGTSVAMAFVSDKLCQIDGINGVVKDGIVPGYYGYDAGQPCAGDMLNWFVENQVPVGYYEKAETFGMGIHEYLSSISAENKPFQNSLTVLDWFNGNRGILNDLSLRGSIFGLSLKTRPEDIYCAMIQGIACGTRIILEHLAENGLLYDNIVICGGITDKNDFIRKEYANILGCKIYVSARKNITATSAAVLAAIASGSTPKNAAERLCKADFITVEPDLVHRAEYETIYQRYKKYYNLLSVN